MLHCWEGNRRSGVALAIDILNIFVDFLRPIRTAEAFEAIYWLADLPQRTWPQAGRSNDVTLLKSTATILAAAMFVGDRTMASTPLAGAAAVVLAMHHRLMWCLCGLSVPLVLSFSATSHMLIDGVYGPQPSAQVQCGPLTTGLELQIRPTSSKLGSGQLNPRRHSTQHWFNNCLSSSTKSTVTEDTRRNAKVQAT